MIKNTKRKRFPTHFLFPLEGGRSEGTCACLKSMQHIMILGILFMD
jgi:hypothetical protein